MQLAFRFDDQVGGTLMKTQIERLNYLKTRKKGEAQWSKNNHYACLVVKNSKQKQQAAKSGRERKYGGIMMQTDGWLKVKNAAKYAGVSPRTLLKWLKRGLRHSRPSSMLILICKDDIDEFLAQYAVTGDRAAEIANRVIRELR